MKWAVVRLVKSSVERSCFHMLRDLLIWFSSGKMLARTGIGSS
jgi:hypothetical protein